MRSINRQTAPTLLSRSRTALFNAISSPILTSPIIDHGVTPHSETPMDSLNLGQNNSHTQLPKSNQGETATPEVISSAYDAYAERFASDEQSRNSQNQDHAYFDLHMYTSAPCADQALSLPPLSSVAPSPGVEFTPSIPEVIRRRQGKPAGSMIYSDNHDSYDYVLLSD